jgi:hypothetical protein
MYGDPISDLTNARQHGGRLARLAVNPAGAIYGTIVVTAVIAATDAHGASPAETLVTTVVTLVVFWFAHVYAYVVAHRLRHNRLDWASVPKTIAHELPMLEGPAPSLVLLLLGAVGLLGANLAVDLALWFGVVQLVAWGVITARLAGWSWLRSVGAGLVNGVLGAVIIVLKALLHSRSTAAVTRPE